MYRPLSLLLASRFMAGRSSSRMISFISTSSTVGIAVGIAAIILVLSAMNGFEQALKEKLLGVIPHGELIAMNKPIENWQGFREQLLKRPDIEGVSPFIQISGMIARGSELRAVKLRGIDSQLQQTVSNYQDYLQPDVSQSLGGRQLILGAGIAEALDVQVGDRVNVLIPPPPTSSRLSAPKSYPFEVVSIFRFGGQLDGLSAWINLEQARELAGYQTGVQGLELKLTDVFRAQSITYQAALELPIYVYVSDWMRSNGHVYQDIQMVRTLVYLVMVLIIGVACFNIVSTLVMAVQDKRSEIAILLTMGTPARLVMASFIWQGLLSGCIGVIFGASTGSLLAYFLPDLLALVEAVLGHTLLSGDIYFIDQIPTELHGQDVLVVSLVAWLTALLATLYPAFKASKLEPAKELGGH